jgi:hypothetical protein
LPIDPNGGALLFSRPFHPGPFLGHVTEPVPVKLSLTVRTAQFDIAIGHGHDFPVTLAGAAIDMDFLPRLEIIGFENSYIMNGHPRLASSNYGLNLFKLFKLIMPSTGIAKGLRTVTDLRAFLFGEVLIKTGLPVPAFKFIDVILIVRVFDMEFFAPAYRTL